jgi:hypothetical protein
VRAGRGHAIACDEPEHAGQAGTESPM